jgi:broad specificity phosphatase PhoE
MVGVRVLDCVYRICVAVNPLSIVLHLPKIARLCGILSNRLGCGEGRRIGVGASQQIFGIVRYSGSFFGGRALARLKKVMVIRHGEKPKRKGSQPFGLSPDGVEDWESLTVRGWQRAGALAALLAPHDGGHPVRPLATPSVIFASKPGKGAASDTKVDGSKSKRPLQTITPLANKLKLSPKLTCGKGDEAKLAQNVLAQTGVVLISWQHERIRDIAQHLVKGRPPKKPIPSVWPGNRFDVVWIFDPPRGKGKRWRFAQVPQRLLKGDRDTVLR